MPTDEAWWMIERHDLEKRPMYFCWVHRPGELPKTWPQGSHDWTPDWQKGERFASREDAEKHTNGDPLLSVVEHAMMEVTMPTDEEIERVARAICFEDGPHGCGCVGQCKSDPFPPDDIFVRYARAAIAALRQSCPTCDADYREENPFCSDGFHAEGPTYWPTEEPTEAAEARLKELDALWREKLGAEPTEAMVEAAKRVVDGVDDSAIVRIYIAMRKASWKHPAPDAAVSTVTTGETLDCTISAADRFKSEEPTEAMVEAGLAELENTMAHDTDRKFVAAIYRAMKAARR